MIDKRFNREELTRLGIYDLRTIGRLKGVASPTKHKKETLIDMIIDVQEDSAKVVPISNRGRPVKFTALQSIMNLGEPDLLLNNNEPDAGKVFIFEDGSGAHDFDRQPLSPNIVKLEVGKQLKIIDVLSPIQKGGRILITGDGATGKTYLLQQLAKAIKNYQPSIKVIMLLVDEVKENYNDFEGEDIEVIATNYANGSLVSVSTAEKALISAKNNAMENDVVFLVDSLDRLAKDYSAFMPNQHFASSIHTIANVKKFFGCAKPIDGGSLTIIATLDASTCSEQLLEIEINRLATTKIALDSELASKRIFPAINIAGTFTRKDEKLLTKSEYEKNVNSRREMLKQEPDEAVLKFGG